MRHLAWTLGIWMFSVGSGFAGPYDGVYVTNPMSGPPDRKQCSTVPVLIADDRLQFFAVRCDLRNPVKIRALDGILYDGTCWLDSASKQGRVLIRRTASGNVALVTPYMDVQLAACQSVG